MEALCYVTKEGVGELTGDSVSSVTSRQKAVDDRLRFVLTGDDPDLVWDLRELNSGRPEQFSRFWEEFQHYIEETAAAAVDERRHDSLLHIATAMSANDLYNRMC